MTMQILAMTAADYAEARSIWEATEGIGLSDADSREGVLAFLERNPGLSLVAKQDGRIIGTVLCGHDGRRGYLHHLAVAPEYRGQGLGRRLVDTCLARLAAAGIQKCHAWVYTENRDGQGFWRKIGWHERHDLRIITRETKTMGEDGRLP
jgi:putative acetyltransferase